MDIGCSPKRPPDSTADSTLTASRSVRPRQLPPPAPPSSTLNSTFRDSPVLKPSHSSEAVFRLLCPASKTASLRRHLCDIPGARIHIDEPVPSCDECVIVIFDGSPSKPNLTSPENDKEPRDHDAVAGDSDAGSQALLRVFEIMVKANEVRVEDEETEKNSADSGSNDRGMNGEIEGIVVCRLLAPSNQVGHVLGRGGKVVEKIRQESMAQVKVFPKDQIPACASLGDELIQMTGSFGAVKKAILAVSSCLQESNSCATKPLGGVSHMPIQLQDDPSTQRRYAHNNGDHRLRGYSENVGPGHSHRVANGMEEDVVFRLLCQPDKVGSLIGKGGTIVRALQNETGAAIKIVDTPDLDERVVVISARESLEQTYSPAQEAVIRVHSRIAELGYEPGAAVVARLLVHAQQIGYLVGRGGHIISEMSRGTGTNIHIFPRDQIHNSGPDTHEVVQVIGSMQSVQDALFHITNRLRDTAFPLRPHMPNFNTPSYMPEAPPPFFRPPLNNNNNNPHSPQAYPPSQAGVPRGFDRFAIHSHPLDHQPAYSHPMSYNGNNVNINMEGVPYPHGPCPPFDGPSPRAWTPQPQVVGSETTKATTEVGFGIGSSRNEPYSSVEMVIPQALFCHIYGENNSSIAHVQKISGAKVVVGHEPKLGLSDGKVIVSGAPDQIWAAQRLVHAFILCSKTQSS